MRCRRIASNLPLFQEIQDLLTQSGGNISIAVTNYISLLTPQVLV